MKTEKPERVHTGPSRRTDHMYSNIYMVGGMCMLRILGVQRNHFLLGL